MSAVVETEIQIDEWHGCYRAGWQGLITPAAFAHPAKYARKLIERIYDHVVMEGWATKGSGVIDPFGGVALGAFDAMRHGLNWCGCELEAKFVALGSQNIALWSERFSRMPNWGSARLLQGDSRKLSDVLSAAECCVSSPPYAATAPEPSNKGIDYEKQYQTYRSQGGGASLEKFVATQQLHSSGYGSSEGQLGAMKEGDHSLVVSSPPYVATPCRTYPLSTGSREHGRMTEAWNAHQKTAVDGTGYGSSEGQLGAMPEGQLCVSSPPYNPPMSQDHNGSRGGQRGTTPSEKGAFVKYGNTEGQLEGLPMEGHEIAISSPPFPQPYTGGGGINVKGYSNDKQRPGSEDKPFDLVGQRTYQSKGGERTEGNLETAEGETFWSASRLILEQLHQVIVPGGHAVFVVKAFVRDKKIVDFPAQWTQLCEAVGFKLLHDHHALLTEHYGTQGGFDEDKEIAVARKSFFRRLAESKGSPRIDHENVLCFERP